MDGELVHAVERARAGDRDALRQLVTEYDSAMRRVAHNIAHDREDAHDAVQEAWIVVVQRLPTLRDPARFPAWLYRIVVRCATRRRQAGASYRGAIDRLMRATPHDGGAHSGGEHEPPPPHVAGALHALSTKDSLVVGLHYFGGIAVKDIARLLDVPLGTVKSRLYHARQTLRRELERMDNSADTHTPQEFRKVIAGTQGDMPWRPMFDGSWDGWLLPREQTAANAPDGWETVGEDGLVGEDYSGGAVLQFGESAWRDIEVSALVTPIHGGNAQVFVRVGADGWYTFDLMLGWQVAAIHKITRQDGSVDLARLSAVNYPLEHGREYAIDIAARGQSITTYIDGAVVNQVTDDTWTHGRVALSIWASKTLYRNMRYRTLDEN